MRSESCNFYIYILFLPCKFNFDAVTDKYLEMFRRSNSVRDNYIAMSINTVCFNNTFTTFASSFLALKKGKSATSDYDFKSY